MSGGGQPSLPPDFFCAEDRSRRMRKLASAYFRLLNVLLVVSVAALIVPVTLQMISRLTGLIPAWIWTEEMARFLFIWMVMLGAMIGVREGTHFEVDVWPEMKPRANAALGLVSMVFVLITALIFVWYGINFVRFGWNQTSELAELPMAWIFVAWPLTGATWLLFGIPRLLADIRILRYGPTPEDVAVARDIGTGSLI
jgi:TRAP-type transport system small permease protein